MLTLLSLKDFVIVPTLTIEAKTGRTCLTGETGAGKSILIDALQLVLGGRSDTGVIREGAERTEVTAEFSMTARAKAWLEAAGLDDNETLLMRRTVDVKGRSRCWVNGTPVAVAQMKELGELLIDVHSQHQNLLLNKEGFQLNVLDILSHNEEALSAYQHIFGAWKQAQQDLEALVARAYQYKSDEDYIRFLL